MFVNDLIAQTGNDLVSREHYNSEEIRERIHTLSEEWEQLTSASAEKGLTHRIESQ